MLISKICLNFNIDAEQVEREEPLGALGGAGMKILFDRGKVDHSHTGTMKQI